MSQAESQRDYTEERTDEGFLNGFRRASDGLLIGPNPENRDYKAFLEWNDKQTAPLNTHEFVIPSNHRFFTDLDELVDHCRNLNVMLYDSGGRSGKPAFPLIVQGRLQDGTVALLLYKAVPAYSIGPPPVSGVSFQKWNVWVSEDLYVTIQSEIVNEDNAIRRVSSWPITRAFVYIDVSDFSKFPAGQQALVINSIVRLASDDPSWADYVGPDLRKGIEAQICIGDGYIFVFKDAVVAASFAGWLAYIIERHLALGSEILPVEFHFRMGVHFGEVYCFWDPGRDKWNFIGDGINGGQRVLAAAGKDKDDVVYVSGRIRKEIEAARKERHEAKAVLSKLHNRGRHKDKHDNYWRLYEMNHTDLVAPWCKL